MSDTAQTAEHVQTPEASPVQYVEMKFRWKKDKLDNQRQTIEVKAAPVPSKMGIAEIYNAGGKDLDLLLEVTADTVRSAVAEYLADNETATAETIPWAQFTWSAIANQPKEDRAKIAVELWDGFVKDYIEIMPGITNKSEEAVTNATVVYLKKFSIVKTDKKTLGKLKEQLGLYIEHTKNGEKFQEILDLLTKKVELYLKSDDVAQLVANL